MPSKTKRKFSKKIKASISTPSDTGSVWSGRGTGIPVAGAVDGSADGSKYLGRPRRPWYIGNRGSPSQSADSGFSSRLGGVNKGHEVSDEYMSMFPDQEEETSSAEPEEERLAINKKLPIYTSGGGASRSPMLETDKEMENISNLRAFIREVAKEEVVKRKVEQPSGYLLFKSDYLGTEDPDDQDETGYVNFKTDDGMMSYEPRVAIQERMLRKIIRARVLGIVESAELQKKRS
jgi:hypothetical protein